MELGLDKQKLGGEFRAMRYEEKIKTKGDNNLVKKCWKGKKNAEKK